MATIDELQRLDDEIRIAEHDALQSLAAHLRASVRHLPSQSNLARTFVRYADRFEADSYRSSPALPGGNGLFALNREIEQEGRAAAAVHLQTALACLSSRDSLYNPLERVVDIFDRD